MSACSSSGALKLACSGMALPASYRRSRVIGSETIQVSSDTGTVVLIETNAPVMERPGGTA